MIRRKKISIKSINTDNNNVPIYGIYTVQGIKKKK